MRWVGSGAGTSCPPECAERSSLWARRKVRAMRSGGQDVGDPQPESNSPMLNRNLFASYFALTIVAICAFAANGQSPVRDYRRAHERQILDEFTRLLAIPNVASDRQNIRRNAEFILEMMQRRGLGPRLLETATKESPPAVYGEWKVPGATHSIVLYAHYDGQPTDPKQWTGTLPWRPTWRSRPLESGGRIVTLADDGQPIDPEWRLYGRSSSDDKAGAMALVAAFDTSH